MAVCGGSRLNRATVHLFLKHSESSRFACLEESTSPIGHVRWPEGRTLRPSVVVASPSGRGVSRASGDSCYSRSDSSKLLSRSLSKNQNSARKAGEISPLNGFSKEIEVGSTLKPKLPRVTLFERTPSASEWAQLPETPYFDAGVDFPPWLEDVEPDTRHKDVSTDLQTKPTEEKPSRKLHSKELATRWREIQGESEWSGLLDPLDRVLREEIMRYGEFAQATYDAFDYEPLSKYCGSSRFNKKKLLESVGLENSGYEVTKFLYAMADVKVPRFFRRSIVSDPWSRDSNWMGFIAVATNEEEIQRLGRRDIVVSWRGTVMALEWLENLHDYLTPTSPAGRGRRMVDGSCRRVKVEGGFYSLYTSKSERTRYNKDSASEQVKEEIQRLVELYADEELSITITGHSLGGALATLSAYDIVKSKCNQRRMKENDEHDVQKPVIPRLGSIPVTVFSFAAPRVGNDAFRDRLEELGVNVLRTLNVHDIVPKVPGLFVNEKAFDMFGRLEQLVSPWLDRLPWTYTHVGKELKLDQIASPFLKPHRDYTSSHNLEIYLHLLDGYHGPKLPYERVLMRDIALVNKSCGLLKDEFGVPTRWWQQANKGLVRSANGEWVAPERPEDEVPSSKAHDHWV